MQERPDKTALLLAIARFLVEDARPALSDPRLAFRALIAANLANIVSSELASDGVHATRELARLRALLPDEPQPEAVTVDEKRAQVASLTKALATRLAGGAIDDTQIAAIGAALRESLVDKLSIDNPRFDVALDVE